ncbi:MAG: glutamate---cysteine ligase / carboxylate-amine ligase [Solirubrobacteraceae bacterium]|nr:glutamate---cysteine ligase / carboxylate-amine ligase [Solirubrobacteraceae bacterium]
MLPAVHPAALTAEALRAAFEEPSAMTVGIEEELMLLDARSLDLAPRAPQVLAATGGDPRFKPELPAAQLEIAVPPASTVPEAAAALAVARADLARAAAPDAVLAGAGAHPFAAPEGVVHPAPRYERLAEEFGAVIRHQLLFGLHVHVAVRPADRALAVYNALRSYLPDLAALAANAPFYAGRDTGLASVRPKIADILPRQGVPPEIPSWEALADELRWGRVSGGLPEPGQWWFEARLHLRYGTVELRVPDAQSTVADTAAVAAVAHCLVAWLAERHAAGEPLEVAATWRIAENRWAACRHGADAALADLVTGEVRPARLRLHELLDDLQPVAERIGCGAELSAARDLADGNGAVRQRAVAAERGLHGLVEWLAERFLAPARHRG